MINLESIKQKIRANLLAAKKDKYHKRGALLGFEAELEAMMGINISIPEMVTVLKASGLEISAQSLRSFFKNRYNTEYDDYLHRNGWHRKKSVQKIQPTEKRTPESFAAKVSEEKTTATQASETKSSVASNTTIVDRVELANKDSLPGFGKPKFLQPKKGN